jgi:hypothetical protein
MTETDAAAWLHAARGACDVLRIREALLWIRVSVESLWTGTDKEKLAVARVCAIRARDVWQIASIKVDAREQLEWEAEARVLGFCAAVLRATVEEQEPDLAAENARLQVRVAALEEGLRDVVDSFRDALPYVPTYFREKWGYDDAIEKARKLGEGGRS